MINYMETILSAFKTIVDDEPTPPLNIIEASHCWLYYGIVGEAIAFEEAGLNTTEDDELKGMLKDAEKLCKAHMETLESFMVKEGLPLPPISESKPHSNPRDIPPGVKLTEAEISNGLALKIIAMSNEASLAASQCVRTDIGAIWVKHLNEALAYGMTLKTKMRKRGWAKMPPNYTPPGV